MTLDHLITKARIFEIHAVDNSFGSYEAWANTCAKFGLYTFDELKKFSTDLVNFSFAEQSLDEPNTEDIKWYGVCKQRLMRYFK